uniref:Uncharacterized protein n=1 Tax=Rhizophora mucronata TaxID=61149 RepID=A0A2P2QBL8_RHIMU
MQSVEFIILYRALMCAQTLCSHENPSAKNDKYICLE